MPCLVTSENEKPSCKYSCKNVLAFHIPQQYLFTIGYIHLMGSHVLLVARFRREQFGTDATVKLDSLVTSHVSIEIAPFVETLAALFTLKAELARVDLHVAVEMTLRRVSFLAKTPRKIVAKFRRLQRKFTTNLCHKFDVEVTRYHC